MTTNINRLGYSGIFLQSSQHGTSLDTRILKSQWEHPPLVKQQHVSNAALVRQLYLRASNLYHYTTRNDLSSIIRCCTPTKSRLLNCSWWSTFRDIICTSFYHKKWGSPRPHSRQTRRHCPFTDRQTLRGGRSRWSSKAQ